jgi:tripartite-type tricarboxylate transporter receptor subunit TctC
MKYTFSLVWPSTLFLLALALTPLSSLFAQAYPTHTVQMIVPYVAGGSIDTMSRAVAAKLSELWNIPVVIDNRPGASGMIGTEQVTKAAPDGYTLLGHTSSYTGTAAIRAKLPFDPARAIVPVGGIGRSAMILAIHPSVPAKNVAQLVSLLKKNPGKLHYGSSGIGGNNHFSGALFDMAAGTQMIHIPYKGISSAMTALASGEVEVVIASAAAVNPQLRAGRVRALAMSGDKPSALLPGLPSVAQSGVGGYQYALWWAIFTPAGISSERKNFINNSINKALQSAEIKKFLDQESAEPWISTADEMVQLLPTEIDRYRKIAKLANIPLQ